MEERQHQIYLGQVHRMVDLFTNVAAVGNATEIIGNGLIAAHALGVDVLVRGLNAYIEKGHEGIPNMETMSADADTINKEQERTVRAKDATGMKTCAYCGKIFKSDKPYGLYCSSACRAMSQRIREKEGQVKRRNKKFNHVCQVCKKPFVSGSQGSLYCSRQCKNKAAIEVKKARLEAAALSEKNSKTILEEKPKIETKESRAGLSAKDIVSVPVDMNTEIHNMEKQKACGQMRKDSPAGKAESGRYSGDQF